MPTNFVIGQILMLFARREIQTHPGKAFTFPFKAAMLYSALIFLPVTGWYFYAHTGWSTVYLRAENQIPFWAGPFILSMYFLGMVFGAGTAQLLIQQGHKKIVYGTLALGIFWLAGVWAMTLDEYLHVGTFAEYHGGTAKKFLEDLSFQKELNVMGALLFLPAIALAFVFYRRSKNLVK